MRDAEGLPRCSKIESTRRPRCIRIRARPALHRLNRTEYANSIRDLLDLDSRRGVAASTDDMSHGFDNMADVLTMSPALMEGYIRAAGKISREAVGDPAVAPSDEHVSAFAAVSQMRHVEGTPFGTRGGISVTHNFPADGEYIFKMSLLLRPSTVRCSDRNQGKGAADRNLGERRAGRAARHRSAQEDADEMRDASDSDEGGSAARLRGVPREVRWAAGRRSCQPVERAWSI